MFPQMAGAGNDWSGRHAHSLLVFFRLCFFGKAASCWLLFILWCCLVVDCLLLLLLLLLFHAIQSKPAASSPPLDNSLHAGHCGAVSFFSGPRCALHGFLVSVEFTDSFFNGVVVEWMRWFSWLCMLLWLCVWLCPRCALMTNRIHF